MPRSPQGSSRRPLWLLQLPEGEPVVELHRTTYTADGTVVEYAIGVHAASRFAWDPPGLAQPQTGQDAGQIRSADSLVPEEEVLHTTGSSPRKPNG